MTKSPPCKPIHWVGSSKSDLLAMPADVQRNFGHALHEAQIGETHELTKPLSGFGNAKVLEVCVPHDGNAFRAVYTIEMADAVYVLHVFQKKSKKGIATPKPDMDLIKHRLATARRDAEPTK